MRWVGFWVLAYLLIFSSAQADDEPVDWSALDWQLDRPLMVNRYMYRSMMPADPQARYLELTRYQSDFFRLDLEQFLALPEAQIIERRQAAKVLRDKAREILLVLGRMRDAGLSLEGNLSQPSNLIEGGADLIPETMGRLINAAGIDPGDAVTWYDLAFFANCVGDGDLLEHAVSGFEAAYAGLDQGNQVELTPLRIRVNLDLAWLFRQRGEMDAGLARTLKISELYKADSSNNATESREARLIAALIHAEMGDMGQAKALAAPLVDFPYVKRNAQANFDPRGPSNAEQRERNTPEFRFSSPGRGVPSSHQLAVPAQKGAWEHGKSNWARNWVLALVDLRMGNIASATKTLGPPDPLIEYPPHLNYRYWNDRGRIYEAAGSHAEARRCYALATIHRPFFLYYPLEGMRGVARSYDDQTVGYSYFLGCGDFYTGGSLFSYASNCLLTYELELGLERKARYAELADQWLTACLRRDIRPARATALRGRLYFFQGDFGRAETDLLTAHQDFVKAGLEDAEVVLMLGLLSFNSKDYPGAEPWLREFNQMQPDAGIGWRAMGLVQTFTGHLNAGEKAFTRAVNLEPNNPGGWFNRALVRIKLGDRAGALADLEAAARLLPNNTDIARVQEAVREGPLPSLDLSPSPITLNASAESVKMMGRLQQEARINLATEVATDEEQGWWEVDTETAKAAIPELERTFRFDPSSQNRANLAWGYLAADNPAAAQKLLAPLWEQDIMIGDLVLLLESDRALGDSARSVALAHGLPGSWERFPDPEVWSRVAAICMQEGRDDLGQLALKAMGGLKSP